MINQRDKIKLIAESNQLLNRPSRNRFENHRQSNHTMMTQQPSSTATNEGPPIKKLQHQVGSNYHSQDAAAFNKNLTDYENLDSKDIPSSGHGGFEIGTVNSNKPYPP